MNSRRLFIALASIAVSVAILLVILRDVPLNEVLESLREADLGYVLVSLLMILLGLVVRGIRWSVLLGRRISYVESTHMINVAFLGNQLPFRFGEVARSILATRKGVALASSASSIVAERLIDTLVVVLVIAISVSQLPLALPEVSERASLFGLLALAGFIVLLGLARFPEWARRLLGAALEAIPPLRRLPLESILVDLLSGLQPLTQVRALAIIGFWTVAGWVFSLITFYFLHLALGIETDFARSVPLGIALAALAIALPVSIAGLGPFEGAILITGQMVGMSQLEAISLGFLFHGVTVLSYALWGTIGLLALGVSPRAEFSTLQRRVPEKVNPD